MSKEELESLVKGNCRAYPRFSNLLKSAKRRRVELKIDQGDWQEFMNSAEYKCTYCNSDVSNETGGGLDRINNEVGYIRDNLKVCCKICNSMKSSLSEDEFKAHIVKISKNI